MEPGVYAGIPNVEYHSGPGISKSGLDLIHRSPLHYHAIVSEPDHAVPTPDQQFGTDFHELLLEPDLFDDTHVLPFEPPEGALATVEDLQMVLREAGEKISGAKSDLIERVKAIRPDAVILAELRQQYAITNAGRRILQPDAWERLQAMRASVLAHPAASALLTGCPGKAELSVYWNDPITGVLCRCRPDWWRDDDLLVDLKTTTDASPEGFARSIATWRYDIQDPFYSDGIELATGRRPRGFVFVAVEKQPPFAVGVYRLDEDSVELGRAQYRADLDRYAECVQADDWPGYGDRIQAISVPRWHLARNAYLLDAAA